MTGENDLTGLEIAVIGMSGRFPGARNIHEFWDNLKDGVESISFFSTEELKEFGSNEELLEDPWYVKAKGILEDIEYFDSFFFDYTAREAELMDPQIRIFHECAWEALEDAGYDAESYDGLIGLYAGAAHNHYWEGLAKFSGKSDELGQWTAYQLVDKDYLTMRISYKLNLIGPSFSMYTACSTSLVAIHLACQAILNGECDMALAGGITVMLPNEVGYLYQEGMIMSPDGHCRAFDAVGKGTMVGNGAGIVVLKRLEDTITDRDYLYAVIRGSAINNDGIRKSGFTAPSVEGQVEAVRAAQQMGHVEPETITYVETHGTGTSLGDPIEVGALRVVFDTDRKNFCALGSVKTNIGHLDAAAGVAGFIKTVLALKHRLIPPSLHFESPNPKIDFEDSPFYVNTELSKWENNKFPLRAGVSSFGIGGTNAHVVLEEAPAADMAAASASREYQLILLSAKTPSSLDKVSKNLTEYLTRHPEIYFPDVAYTLQVGRKALQYRRMLICSDAQEAIDTLGSYDVEPSQPFFAGDSKPSVIYIFPGQGGQYVNMGLDLYNTEPVFREEMDRCFDILKSFIEYDIKEILYPATRSAQLAISSEKINQTEIAQPVLFVFEYALAKLLMKWGIKPYAMIGHSIGEYVAACLAGVFPLEDALKLVAVRGKLMQQVPPGAMVSVPLPEEELKPLLHDQVALAAVNDSTTCVVSGSHEAVEVFTGELNSKGYECRRLHTSHAFHSCMMDPILHKFAAEVRRVSLNKPGIPYISNVTGQWITVEESAAPEYWAAHLRRTVRFADGITELLQEENSIFLEVGPGRTLSAFVRKHKNRKEGQPVINLIKHPKEDVLDSYFLLDKIGRLWFYGVQIDWTEFYFQEKRQRVPLPTYPFERRRYWIEGEALTIGPGMLSGKSLSHKKSDMADWFYIPSWKRSVISENKTGKDPALSNWLLFCDACGLGLQLVKRLETEYPVTIVRTGSGFGRSHNGEYTLNPALDKDYDALLNELRSLDKLPQRIVHLWSVTGKNNGDWKEIEKMEGDQDYRNFGFYSLLYLAQAIGKQNIRDEIRITVLTDEMQEVTGEEKLCPLKATVLGPVGVIPQEYPNIQCNSIDVVISEPGSKKEKKLVDQLAAELISQSPDKIIAFRNNHRLVQTFEPVRLEAPEEKIPRLKEKGVYLITGGLGGIGLVLARHLAETVRAKLVLVGRSSFPARNEWDNWLTAHHNHDPISRKIVELLELEKSGAEVLVLSGDVTDYQQMERVVVQAEERFGRIRGVIHSAGIPGGGVIQLKKPGTAENVLSPKVRGTLVLERLLKDHPLDFFLLCSSVNSILPLMGQVDYYSANAFLDAFAYHKTSADGIFTVSINWDTWQEVGMAVNAFSREVVHPLLERHVSVEPHRQKYITHLKLSTHWVLNEHMTRENKGILPGVTYLEMVRAAFENHTGTEILEFSDVYFLNPLVVGKDEEIEVFLDLKKEDNGYDFVIKSRTNPNGNTWQNHAVGKVAGADLENKAVTHKIKEIASKCSEKNIKVSEEKKDSSPGLLIFGPRWQNLKQVRYGNNHGLALLQLPDAYVGDLESYMLHPALLDTAAAFLSRYVSDKNAYIPFSYKKVKVKGPLPAKIFSYSRLVENKGSKKDFLAFDITIMDEHGKELVDIKEFSMLEVSERVKTQIKEKEFDTDSVSTETDGVEMGILENGIRPSEGIDIFNRVLGGGLPQVVVSTTDLTDRIKKSDMSKTVLLDQELKKRALDGPKHPRPQLSSTYAIPRTDTEQMIAGIWQDVLGIEQVGVNDDFFELGGDSVSIIQLNRKLKKALGRDIPDVIIFRYLTISSFIEYLKSEEEETNKGTSNTIMDRSGEIKKSKSRLKERFSRR